MTENGSSQPGSSQVEDNSMVSVESASSNISENVNVPEDICAFYERMDHDDEETELQTVSFEINQDYLEQLQKR
jgi:hypothetical protein